MATRHSRRRQGGAMSVLHPLALEAEAADAREIYLGVMADNVGARSLYDHAGFVTVHEAVSPELLK
jgi:ribosomal protein S18 acetylase RimI-like enzyme